jgi:hypothetical protein
VLSEIWNKHLDLLIDAVLRLKKHIFRLHTYPVGAGCFLAELSQNITAKKVAV